MRLRAASAALILLFATHASAEVIGTSLAVSNDSQGYYDRWQSNSVQAGVFTRQGGGPILEYRFRSDILSPELKTPVDPDDRRHAGVLSFGLHAYRDLGSADLRFGGDIVAVGPDTGILELQKKIHEIFGYPIPDYDGFEIEDALRPQLSAEVGRSFAWRQISARPFAEAILGPEDMLRAGIDLIWAPSPGAGPMARMGSTGHRLPTVDGGRGISLHLGADVAKVADSLYLPENLSYQLTPLRRRVRAGLGWQGERLSVFGGVAWLDREFEAQPEGQAVGMLHLGLTF